MAEELDNTIRESATGLEPASADGAGVKQESVRDQIEADCAGRGAGRVRWGRSMAWPSAAG